MSKSIQKFYVVSVRGSPARLVTPDANNVRQNYLVLRDGYRSERKAAAAFPLQILLQAGGGKAFYSLNHKMKAPADFSAVAFALLGSLMLLLEYADRKLHPDR